MTIMSKVLNKFFPEVQPDLGSRPSPKQDNKKSIAAITVAIKHHREG